ncbi:hypothetical protein KVV02_000228 [Mortierella alpina]|uniref:Transmembrane protein 198 n=1 Tax=Mortierella alpina TaxID=64518 RepID=A0A9P8IG08_MORAP|nr:hypothetical protein KVV02_000228 [Mortierella alpina]
MPSSRYSPYSQLAISVWLFCTLYNAQYVVGAPLPQASDNSSGDGSLGDPFSTPDYLAPSKFTWEQGVYGVMFLFFGAIEVLRGYKYIRFTMLVAGFLVWASTAVMIMLIVNMNSGVYQSSGIYFMVWLLVGIGGSLISFYLWHVGIILTGAYGMFVIVAIIFTAANVRNYVFRYTVLAICVVVGGYLTHRYERLAVIFATSLGGAYCMMFGLDMFVQAEFRATFHVMLSQSSERFHPTAGTWVMVACVPVIAVFGIIWELKHHDEPVGSWWFGHGARPLPPLPGEKPVRRCCGIPLSRSAKSVKAAKAAAAAKDTEGGSGSGSSSESTLVPPQETGSTVWSCCIPRRAKKGKPVEDTSEVGGPEAPGALKSPSTSSLTSASGKKDHIAVGGQENITSEKSNALSNALSSEVEEDADKAAKDKMVSWSEASHSEGTPSPPEKAHPGVYKVTIKREVREFGVSVDERL